MSTKHTPGPWRISGCQLGDKLLIEHGGAEEMSPCIGSVYFDGARLPQQANARLIAAAPELLEALKAMVGRWEPDTIGQDRVMWENAVEAIAKAESSE